MSWRNLLLRPSVASLAPQKQCLRRRASRHTRYGSLLNELSTTGAGADAHMSTMSVLLMLVHYTRHRLIAGCLQLRLHLSMHTAQW